MKTDPILPENIKHARSGNFFLIAGPCVIEGKEISEGIAGSLSDLSDKYQIPLIFKASYRKANRSRLDSFTGLGDREGLEILAAAGARYGLPLLTDIHTAEEAALAAGYVDVLQIPAFLCRQTDLLLAAGETGKIINIKKGQFLSGSSMKYAVEKVRSTGNQKVMLTERGSMFGYQDMVVDFRNIPLMQENGCPVITDITHSLQQPNQSGGVTGGNPEMIETLAKAALAAGSDGLFLETHPRPAEALSDGANMLPLEKADALLQKLIRLQQTLNQL